MATTPLAIITSRAPALAADPGVTLEIALAEDQIAPVSPTSWKSDDVRALAVALLAMHSLTLNQTRLLGEAGAVVSKKEGEAAIAFSDKSRNRTGSADDDLDQTVWGRQLLGLASRTFVPIGVAGSVADARAWEVSLWQEDI